jgi:flagellar protein FlaJ
MLPESFLNSYKKASIRLFGKVVDQNMETFKSLKVYLAGSEIRVLLRTWASMILFTTMLFYFVCLGTVALVGYILQLELVALIYYVIFLPVLLSSFVFMFFYIYPIQKSKTIRKSIDNNLPFALAHMNAIVSSGIPPEFMFDLLTGFKEYGNVATQSGRIVRNIKSFGMSSVDAINDVAKRTPSPAFRQILNGITSTIEKGGDLTSFLKEMSEKALFDYRMKREKYIKTLSTYADIYTAFMITAPLMMLSVLVMMSIVGGQVLGFGIEEILFLITWIIIPSMNVGFLIFVHITYPGS